MRSTIVGGPASKLYGAKCRLCPKTVTTGQAVLVDTLPTYGYVDNRYVMHVDCVKAAADRAPAGVPVRNVKVEQAELRRRALAITHGG